MVIKYIFRESGLVASAASDWSLDQTTVPMSLMIAFGGLSAAAFGKWTIKVNFKVFKYYNFFQDSEL